MLGNDYLSILQTLVDHDIEFIVVGGVAAVLNGVPLNTFDVDVVHSRAAENVDKLVSALQELDAYYRIQPERRFRPNASHLSCPGHQLLHTKFGPADFLGSVSKKRTYEDLRPNSQIMDLGPTLSARVLNLEMLITLKEEAGREKDLAVLPILRHTAEEIRRRRTQPASPSTDAR